MSINKKFGALTLALVTSGSIMVAAAPAHAEDTVNEPKSPCSFNLYAPSKVRIASKAVPVTYRVSTCANGPSEGGHIQWAVQDKYNLDTMFTAHHSFNSGPAPLKTYTKKVSFVAPGRWTWRPDAVSTNFEQNQAYSDARLGTVTYISAKNTSRKNTRWTVRSYIWSVDLGAWVPNPNAGGIYTRNYAGKSVNTPFRTDSNGRAVLNRPRRTTAKASARVVDVTAQSWGSKTATVRTPRR